MRRITGLTALVALAAAALVLVPGAVGSKKQMTKITVCYANAATDFTPLIVASKEGFDEREGLEITRRLSLGTTPQLVQQGTCQIGVASGPEFMLLYAAGVDVAMIGGWQNRFGFKLLVRTDRGIDKPADLKGHNIGVSTVGGSPDQSARALLKFLKLVPDTDVKILYIPSITARLAALAQGSIDSAIFSPPVTQITQDGKVKDILDMSFLRAISVGVWTKRDYAAKNPLVIKGFLRANVESRRWMVRPENKAKVLTYISEMTGITSPEGLNEAYKYGVVEHLPREPTVDPVALRNSIQFVSELYGKNVNANDFLYLGPLEQVLTYTLSGTLTAGKEVPKPRGAAAAKGAFTGTLKQNGELTWKLTTSGLTGPATGAHLHLGAAGKAGPVKLALCTNCKASQSGTAKIGTGLSRAIKAGEAYVNVHTAGNPAGEIRSQLSAEPGK